ncbi:MAG TPA: cytochrome P450 [Ilumatobacteraceae bacterium]|jgi:cytochrome P450|nr:cytochrome P450 [Ilumatobacteraceae bacterium]
MDEPRPLPRPPWREQPGHLRRIFQTPHVVLDDLSDQYGPVCGLGAGPARMAIVGDPAALRELFAMPNTSFRWNHKFNVLGFVVGKNSMIVSDGDDHRRRRSSVQTAFSRRRLNGWIPMIVEQTDAAIDRLVDGTEPGTVVDMYPVGRALVLRIVVRSLFGERMSQRCDEIGDLFQRPQDYLESPAIRQLPHPFPRTARARVRADREALGEIIDAEIAHRRANPTGDPLDILETLVADGTLSDAEIRDQVATLIGAGYDTTSASLAWMLIRTTLVPGLWDRLRAEADRVFTPPAENAATPDASTLAALDLANRVMREAVRLHPAGVLSPREAATDVTVGGYAIPKGTLILWSAHLAGRNGAAWPDPLTFDPDRFVDMDDERRALADIAWVPFGRGARNCIGFALAQMELTLIISRLAQRLDLAPVSNEVPAPVGMVVNRPTGGAPMRIGPRRDGGAAASTGSGHGTVGPESR